MQIRNRIFIFLILALWLQSTLGAEEAAPYDQYIEYVNEITQSFTQQMEEEFGLKCIGDMGQMHEKIEEIGFSFNAYRRASIEEARALEVLVINRLVQAINHHPKIQPFLEERPFSYKRVSISIGFEGQSGRYSDGSVGQVYNATDSARPEYKNKILYDYSDPFTERDIELLKEPYEDAVKLVKAIPLSNLKTHQSTPIEEALDKVLNSFIAKIGEEYRLRASSIGAKMENGIEEIGGRFRAFYRATLEEARELEIAVINKLLHTINTNDEIRPFLKEYPLRPDQIKLKISFSNYRYSTYNDGSMESVSSDGEELSYSREPIVVKGQDWEDYTTLTDKVFAKEPYSEALKIVKTHPSYKAKFKFKMREWFGF